MVLTAAITLLITVLTTTVCFSVFQSFLRKNQIQSAEFSLSVVSNNIGADMKDIIYFSKWCCSNSAVLDYLEAFKDQPKLPTATMDFDNLRPMALSSHSRLKEEYYNTRAYEYMSRVIVSSSNESNFLLIAALANSSSSYAARIIKNEPFFDKLYRSDDFLWIGLVKGPFSNIGTDQIIPIVRPVSNKFNSEVIGWTYVEISSRIFTDYLASYPLPEDSILFITIGDKIYGFNSNGLKEMEMPYTNPVKLAGNASLSKGTRVLSVTMNDGEKRTLVERPIEGMAGWSLSQVLSEQQLGQQKNLYTLLILVTCLTIVSLGILLAFLLNKIIMDPIHKLSSRIHDISTGDFSRDWPLSGIMNWEKSARESIICQKILTP